MIDLGIYTNEVLDPCVIKAHPTGSNYICDPPVNDTDIDWVILIKYNPTLFGELEQLGWKWCGADPEAGAGGNPYENSGETDTHYARSFTAYRRGQYNLIFVESESEFDRWVKATEEARKLNLTNKADRIELFQKYWEKPAEEKSKYKLQEPELPVDLWSGVNAYYVSTPKTMQNWYGAYYMPPRPYEHNRLVEKPQGWKAPKIPKQVKKVVPKWLVKFMEDRNY